MPVAQTDVTRAVLVRKRDDGTEEQVLGIISRPTREFHSNANLMPTLDEILASDDLDPDLLQQGKYFFLRVSVSGTLRRARPSFDIRIAKPLFMTQLGL